MSNVRLATNRDHFVRDLVRDYCAVYLAMAEQRLRLLRDGSVSYPSLNVLLGESWSKGVFWRLKDMAHYIFRDEGPASRAADGPGGERLGRLVDWCVGYAFHECCKLREDAYQGQHYAMLLLQIGREGGPEEAADFSAPLAPLSEQTALSSRRELDRILNVLRSGMDLLVRFLAATAENCSLARWLEGQEAQAEKAFGTLYPALLKALYGDDRRRMHTLAAADLLDCGRVGEARTLLLRARDRGLLDEDGESMLSATGGAVSEEAVRD